MDNLAQQIPFDKARASKNIIPIDMAIPLLILVWIGESFIFRGLTSFKNIFLLTYSFVLALLSVSTINDTVVTPKYRKK